MSDKFQRLFWTIAGAETPILEKCRTDHKKFSIIGAMILMTAFVALCAGTSAAWYFTQKGTDNSGDFWWALAFGCLWATLIFCIDRSLVVTLKKDPTKKRQSFWIPLLSRAVLALVVAFMVSIPLELVIFEDYIASKEEDFNAHQMAVLGEQLKSNSGEDKLTQQISGADSTLVKLGKDADKLGREADELQARIAKLENEKNRPNSNSYNSAKSRYDAATTRYNTAKSNYNAENRKEYPSQTALNGYSNQMSAAAKDKTAAKGDMDVAAKAWRDSRQAEIDRLMPQLQAKRTNKESIDKAYNTTLEGQNIDKERAQKAASDREIKEAHKQASINSGNHFIQNFQILEFAVWQKDKDGTYTESTQLMFLWLVRLLFFIIELLPTIVKIVSPVGSYERTVHAEEEAMKEYLESQEFIDKIRNVHRLALSTQEELQQKQHDAEIELKAQILDTIKKAQLDVAQLAIQKWKDAEVAKLNSMQNSTPPTTKPGKNNNNDDDDDVFTYTAI